MTRVAVVWPYLPAYRVAFCERARRDLADHGVDLRLYTGHAGNERRDARTAEWHQRIPDLHIGGSAGAHLRRLPRECDLLIVEQAIKNLESYIAVAAQHGAGPAVAMWGHGRSYSTLQGAGRAAVKQWLTRRSRWFVAYTRPGADYVVAHGFPRTRITVLNNTTDTESLRASLSAVTPAELARFRAGNGLSESKTAVFVGGVDHAKDIRFLMQAAQEARRLCPEFTLLVVGAGDESVLLTPQQTSGSVRSLGRLEGKQLATALASARVMMIPSAIGLVAVDALTAGLPIVTRDNLSHGPEADYLVDGRTSRWLPAACSPAEYAQEAIQLMSDSERLSAMRAACLIDSQDYSLDAMVETFVQGVLAWSDIERAGL